MVCVFSIPKKYFFHLASLTIYSRSKFQVGELPISKSHGTGSIRCSHPRPKHLLKSNHGNPANQFGEGDFFKMCFTDLAASSFFSKGYSARPKHLLKSNHGNPANQFGEHDFFEDVLR